MNEARFTAPSTLCARPDRWHSVDDDSTEDEVAEAVRGLVRGLQPDLCVETGTAYGIVTAEIAVALHLNGHGRLVTIEVDAERIAAAKMRVGDQTRVEFVHGDSRRWQPDGIIDFAWIDSSPDWHVRLEEFRLYLPYMRSGSIVAFHDTAPHQGGYRWALERVLTGKARFVHMPTPRGFTIAEVR